jgi:hypothetical protein
MSRIFSENVLFSPRFTENKKMPRNYLALSVLLAFALWGISPAAEQVAVSSHPQLFLDDHLLARSENIHRQLQMPEKHPANPVIRADMPWEKRVMLYGTVLYDEQEKLFRCWYLARQAPGFKPPPGTAAYYQCYAESKDGVQWEKPLVGLSPYGPYNKTNIVVSDTHGLCILPGDCPNICLGKNGTVPFTAKQFKAAGGKLLGYSPDGIHWTTQPWDAIGTNDTSTSAVFWQGEFLAFVRNQEKDDRPGNLVQRTIGLRTSKDFINWTPKKTIFMTDQKDGFPWVQPYGLAVTPYGDQLIGLLFMLYLDKIEGNNVHGDMATQMLASRDGRRWTRVADRAGFLEGKKGDWDWRIMCPATSMVVHDDMVYIYYTGANVRHGDKKSPADWAIGLATLTADRFVAVQPADPKKEAVLETRPLQFQGAQLIVNAHTKPDELKVELLDASGRAIDGFTRSDCMLLPLDRLRYRVVWADRSIAQPQTDNKSPALRFILSGGAKLYSFQIR